jgi:hypothetical protein
MKGERLGARVLHAQGDRHRVARVVAPATPGLDRHRQMGSACDRADDSANQIDVTKAARPAVSLYHLLDRTPEVDVDEFGLVVLGDEGGGLRHCARIGAIDLDTDGPLDSLELRPFQGGLDAAPYGLGGEELGQHHIGPHSPADLAKRRLGNPRHRSED